MQIRVSESGIELTDPETSEPSERRSTTRKNGHDRLCLKQKLHVMKCPSDSGGPISGMLTGTVFFAITVHIIRCNCAPEI